MTRDRDPIAWTALREGTPVFSGDGDDLGTVAAVVADREKDIFSGLAVGGGLLSRPAFVPADRIDEITRDGVRLRLSAAEMEKLEPYAG